MTHSLIILSFSLISNGDFFRKGREFIREAFDKVFGSKGLRTAQHIITQCVQITDFGRANERRAVAPQPHFSLADLLQGQTRISILSWNLSTVHPHRTLAPGPQVPLRTTLLGYGTMVLCKNRWNFFNMNISRDSLSVMCLFQQIHLRTRHQGQSHPHPPKNANCSYARMRAHYSRAQFMRH